MPHNASQWFAQRSVQGVGEDGAAERVTIWIERKPGAVWAVGRAIDLAQRTNGAIRDDDYVFEGFEMGDALEAANDALASDLEVSLGDGRVTPRDRRRGRRWPPRARRPSRTPRTRSRRRGSRRSSAGPGRSRGRRPTQPPACARSRS